MKKFKSIETTFCHFSNKNSNKSLMKIFTGSQPNTYIYQKAGKLPSRLPQLPVGPRQSQYTVETTRTK